MTAISALHDESTRLEAGERTSKPPPSPAGALPSQREALGARHTPRLYSLFANLLDYPSSDLAPQAQACAEATATVHAKAAALLDLFCTRVTDTPVDRLQEIYTSTFDLKPNCYPYVGYHLFGESYKRGAFMARLNEEYNARGFATGNELPDHLSIVLRFLALAESRCCSGDGDTEFGRTLLHEGLIPALEQMVGTFDENSGNPYGSLMRALLLLLREKEEEGVSNA
jgi:nitrate reductase delta subunit